MEALAASFLALLLVSIYATIFFSKGQSESQASQQVQMAETLAERVAQLEEDLRDAHHKNNLLQDSHDSTNALLEEQTERLDLLRRQPQESKIVIRELQSKVTTLQHDTLATKQHIEASRRALDAETASRKAETARMIRLLESRILKAENTANELKRQLNAKAGETRALLQARQTISDLQVVNSKTQMAADAAKDETRAITERNEALNKQFGVLEKALLAQSRKVADLSIQNSKLKAREAASAALVAKIEGETDKSKKLNDRTVKILTDKLRNAEIKSQQGEPEPREQLKTEQDLRLHDSNAAKTTQQNLEKALTQQKQSYEQAAQRLSQQHEKIVQRLEQELENFKKQIASLTKDLADARTVSKDREERASKQCNDEKQRLQGIINDLRRQLKDCQDHKTKSTGIAKRLEDEKTRRLDAAVKENTQLKEQLSTAISEKESLAQRMQRASDQQQELDEARRQVSNLTAQVSTLATERDSALTSYQSYVDRAGQEHSDIIKEQTNHYESEIWSLKDQLDTATTSHNDVVEQNRRLFNEITELRNHRCPPQNPSNIFGASNITTTQADFKYRATMAEQEVKGLNKQISDLTRRCKETKSQLDKANTARDQLPDQLSGRTTNAMKADNVAPVSDPNAMAGVEATASSSGPAIKSTPGPAVASAPAPVVSLKIKTTILDARVRQLNAALESHRTGLPYLSSLGTLAEINPHYLLTRWALSEAKISILEMTVHQLLRDINDSDFTQLPKDEMNKKVEKGRVQPWVLQVAHAYDGIGIWPTENYGDFAVKLLSDFGKVQMYKLQTYGKIRSAPPKQLPLPEPLKGLGT